MTESLSRKVEEAKQTLKLAAEMSKAYYGKPLIICYSGGKDSDVMLDLAKKCLSSDDFEVINSHTTIDAPETVYHIREVFRRLNEAGIKTEIRMPTYKGEPTSMWKLIVTKGTPPTRIMRYCCQVLKETSCPNRMIAVGVREDESSMRRGRNVFAIKAKKKAEAEFRGLQHTYAMFKLDQSGNPEAYECEFIKSCKENKDTICNPIYYFTEKDVWEYVREENLFVNPLYEKGYKRVGCIGCPLGNRKSMLKEFAEYPKYRKNYVRAFEKMLTARKERGLKNMGWNSGEDVMRWWVGENPKQIRIDDLMKGGNEDGR